MHARNILLHGIIPAVALLTVCGSMAQADETIELTPGSVKLLRFDRHVGTVAIGNPTVADPFASNDKAILLTGKAVGTTNLIVLDEQGRDLFSADIVVARGEEVGQRITIHSRPSLHSYYEYRCAPNCVLMGRIDPSLIAPTMPVGSAVPLSPELTTPPVGGTAAPPPETTAPPPERAAPQPAR